jgi:TP901 family phage tail tape measure protein
MSSGKHLNIDIDFNANTAKASKEIQKLQNQIDAALKSSIGKSGTEGFAKTAEDLNKASTAAMELKRHLANAFNPETGKLDLHELHKSFASAGKDIESFRKDLNQMGPEGRKAFDQMAKSIQQAEMPIKRSNKLVQEFANTLKNTARWQISSSILHGFMGSIQTAYHYAQDLNESLNNIRIVTGQNTDQMAAFAKQANESAKALNTTTTKYTDAALIYYQQGLSDKEVKARTDVTVKMANVARESAEEVSNQMTSVWNNFNKDGSASVESFADKMTALGAATASSTSEIAEGLSKFSGVADTIGLSFDYATSALATVTATSRESADVVGTAFKTMFARMEGLKQGKTEEDGTDLNKYSQGLAKIGVQIKDQNGELKNMDQILSEMGDRWQGLSRDQKIATAQTVAGVRQYNQLMTLMDNWDFFQKNLAVAQGSEGTLQEQADIYAESWEAAEKRVQAAMETIYSQLLNDEAFIDLNNGIADFIELISNAIKGIGGLNGVLAGLGVVATKVFNKQITSGLTQLFTTDKDRAESWKVQNKQANDARLKQLAEEYNFDPEKDSASNEIWANNEVAIDLKNRYVEDYKKFTPAQRKKIEDQMTIMDSSAEASLRANKDLEINANKTAELNDELDLRKQETAELEKQQEIINRQIRLEEQKKESEEKSIEASAAERKALEGKINKIKGGFRPGKDQSNEANMEANKKEEALNKMRESIAGGKLSRENIVTTAAAKLNTTKEKAEEYYDILKRIVELEKKEKDTSSKDSDKKIKELQKERQELEKNLEIKRKAESEAQDRVDESEEEGKQQREHYDKTVAEYQAEADELNKMLDGDFQDSEKNDPILHKKILAEKISSGVEVGMSAMMTFQSLKGIIDTVGDSTMSLGDKLTAVLSSTTMMIPSVMSGFQALQKVLASTSLTAGPIAAIFAGIVVAIGAVTVGVSELVDWWNKDEDAAKKAAETVNLLKDNYNNLKQANEELKQSLADYNDARRAIQGMVAGTTEWNEAVRKLNDDVSELIHKYPSLRGEVKKINGVYEINNELQEKILKEQEKSLNNNAIASNASQIYAQVTKERSLKTDFTRDVLGSESLKKAIFDNMTLNISDLGEDLYGHGFDAEIDSLVQALQSQGNHILDNSDSLIEATGMNKSLADVLVENKDETNKLTDAIIKSRAERDEAGRESIEQAIKDESSFKRLSEKDQNFFLDASLKKYQKDLTENQELYEEKTGLTGFIDDIGQTASSLIEKFTGNKDLGSKIGNIFTQSIPIFGEKMTLTDEEAGKKGAEYLGAEYLGDLSDNRSNVSINGQIQDISDAMLRSGAATAKTVEDFKAQLSDLVNSLMEAKKDIKKLNENGMSDTEANAFLGILQGKEDAVNKLTQSDYEDLSKNLPKYLDKFVDSHSEEQLQNLGVDPEKAIEIFKSLKLNFEDISKNYSESVKDTFGEIIKNKNITAEAATTIGKTLNDAFLQSDFNSSVLDTFTQMYKEAGSKGADFVDVFNSISWDTVSVADFKEAFSNAGISIKQTDLEIKTLIENLSTTDVSMDNINNQFAKFNEIAGKLNFGDTISDEQYNEMKNNMGDLGSLADIYFVKMLDGTHKLIGDAEDFRDTVKQGMVDKAFKNVIELSTKLKDINYAKNRTDLDKIANKSNYQNNSSLSYARNGNSAVINDQAHLLELVGDADEQKLARQVQDSLENGKYGSFKAGDKFDKELKDMTDALAGHTDNIKDLNNTEKATNQELRSTYNQIALSAKNLKELKQFRDDGYIDESAYNFAANQKFQEERREGLDTKKISDYSSYLQETSQMGTSLGDAQLSDELAKNAELAEDLAIQVERMNIGVKSLADNWENWSSILRKSSEGSEEYFEAANGTKEALADLLDVSKDYISLDFIDSLVKSKDGLDLMNKAAKGNGEAIDELRKKASKDIILKIKQEIDFDKINYKESDFDSLINDLQKEIPNLEVGAELKDDDLIDSLNEMIEETGMSVDQIQSLLTGIGFNTTFASQEENMTVSYPVITKRHWISSKTMDEDTNQWTWTETEAVDDVKEGKEIKVPSFAMASAVPGAQPKAPQIKSLTRKASGSANNGSRSNAGGKKGGKGGGGGKGKGKKIKYRDEFDRYWQINRAIEKNDAALTKLGHTYDYVYGKQRIDNLKAQNKELAKQYANVKALNKEQKKEVSDLKKQNKKNKYGIKFDKNGVITNYNKVTQKEFKRYIKSQKAGGKTAEKGQQRYDDFKKMISDSERVSKAIYDSTQKQKELMRQMIENNFEAWQLKIEVKLEKSKGERDLRNFVNTLNNSIGDIFNKFSYNVSEKIGDKAKDITSLSKDLDTALDKESELRGIVSKWSDYKKKTPKEKRLFSSKSEAEKALKDFHENTVVKLVDEARAAMEEALNEYLQLLSDIHEEYGLVNKDIEQQIDLLNYNKQLIELQYGPDAFKNMKKYHEVNQEALQTQIEASKAQEETYQKQFDEAVKKQKKRNKNFDILNKATWSKDMIEIDGYLKEAQKNTVDAELRYVQELKDAYIDAIDEIYARREDIITKGAGFEKLNSEWERLKDNANNYYDEIEKVYHVETLMNKIDQSIQSEKQIKNAQKLKKFREEELEALKTKKELTKYDIDAANARYQILLKEIALEDARNNKNTMKMTRNEQGNWSYQYVANKDDILKKQQELSDANFNGRDLAKKEYISANEAINKDIQGKEKERADLQKSEKYRNMTESERKAALEEIDKRWEEQITKDKQRYDIALRDLDALSLNQLKINYQNNKTDFEQLEADKLSIVNQYIETGLTAYSNYYAALGGYGESYKNQTLEWLCDGDESLKTKVNSTIDEIQTKSKGLFIKGDDSLGALSKSTAAQVIKDWFSEDNKDSVHSKLLKTEDDIDQELSNFTTKAEGYFTSINDNLDKINQNLGTIKDSSDKTQKQVDKDFKAAIDKLGKAEKAYQKVVDKVNEYLKKIKSIPKSKTTTITTKYKTVGNPSGYVPSGGGSGGGGNSGGGGGSNNKTKPKKDKTKTSQKPLSYYGFRVKKNQYGYYSLYNNSTLVTSLPKVGSLKAAKKEAIKWVNKNVKKRYGGKNFTKFDTGGYTGNWSDNKGRLALLHQKELVLNKQDTKNMLQTINAVRDLQSLNSSITKTITDSVSEMIANGFNEALSKMTNIKDNKETVVIENITAEFPNAENVTEIKEAIMSLPRLASQYVNRK